MSIVPHALNLSLRRSFRCLSKNWLVPSSIVSLRWNFNIHRLPPALRRLSTKRHMTSREGYQSIGSFHSENLAALMALSDEEYSPPSLPFVAEQQNARLDGARGDFLLDWDNWTFLNHGAFGANLKVGYDRASDWRRYAELQPLRFFDRTLLPHLAYSTRRLASFVHAPRRTNVALVPNATAALNAVIAGYMREYGKSAFVIVWDTTYGSVKKMVHHYGKVFLSTDDAVYFVEIPFQSHYLHRLATAENPTDIFLEALQDCISSNRGAMEGKHPLLILDQTTSNTALTFPIASLADLMKLHDPESVVLVDGAHGLLAKDINLSSHEWTSSVDIFVTNGHKWLAAPRGVAILIALHDHWCDTILRRPVIISHGVDEHDLLSRFIWDGTRDYTAALAIPAVLDYWTKHHDPSIVRGTMKQTLLEGIRVLAQHWHPDHVDADAWPGNVTLIRCHESNDNDKLLTPSRWLSPMALVRLPDRLQFPSGIKPSPSSTSSLSSSSTMTSTDAKRVQDYLYDNRIEVPIKCINGQLFVRVSCHIYNQSSDFVHLATAINRYPDRH